MINFVKYSSLMIILLFFPISFHFNIFPINYKNYNSKDNSRILYVDIRIHPYHKGWYVDAIVRTILNVTDVYWADLYRNGNVFYTGVFIEFGKNIDYTRISWFGLIENNTLEMCEYYELGFLKEGNYSFILYVNDEPYIKNFTIKRESIPPVIDAFPELLWNGEEWIVRVILWSNLIPKKIIWKDIFIEKGEFYIPIEIEGWEDEIPEETVVREHNYSIGILPEGTYGFYVYANDFEYFCVYDISRVLTTRVPTRTIVTTTYELGIIIETINLSSFKIKTLTITETMTLTEITTCITIKVKEKTKTSEIEKIETTTMPITFIEETTKKEKFEFEKYSTIFFLLFIVIIATLLLYFILFKGKKI